MLGLAISVQPAFDARWGQAGGLYEMGVGAHRAGPMNPFRTVLQRGLELGAGSDSPVTPLDPMLGIDAFEHHHDPAQRLTRHEAIRAWTNGGMDRHLWIIADCLPLAVVPLERPEAEHVFSLDVSGRSYVRAELRGFRGRPERGEVVWAMTNPIWIGAFAA